MDSLKGRLADGWENRRETRPGCLYRGIWSTAFCNTGSPPDNRKVEVLG